MKTLYFVRHAKSDWSDLSMKDFDRPLNARGMRVAPKMGAKLKEMGEIPEKIVASPAKRTTDTAVILAEQLGKDASHIEFIESIYEASTRELLSIVNGLANHQASVMVVCHNMAVTYISDYLTGGSLDNMPTCGVMKITFEFDDWKLISENTGTTAFFLEPKELGF